MSNLAKSAIGLVIATLLAKALGFVREMVLMYAYGTSWYSDVYITAMNIPIVLFSVIGSALATTFIPLYNQSMEDSGEKGALKFTNNIIIAVTILSVLIALLGYICAEPLVKLFALNFDGEKLVLTVKFVKIMIAGLVFVGISNILTPYLQIKGNFVVPGMIAIPNNIIIIISIILSYMTDNIYILPIGALIGMFSQFIFQLPFAKKNGYKFEYSLNFKDKYLKQMVILVAPVLIGVCVNQVNTMVDRSLASGLGDGVIAALNSANRLNWFVMGLFIVTLTSVIYPTLSKLSNEDNKDKFIESVSLGINSAILLIMPVTIGFIVLSKPIVRILFERGAFDETSTLMTSSALVCYSIGILGQGLRNILDRVFYSLKDTKTPMVNGIISMVLNVILNIIFVKIIGYNGLPLATSLSFLICSLLLFNSLKKKIGYFGEDKIIKTTIKSLIAAIIMGVVTYFTYNILANILGSGFIKEALVLFGSVGIGALVYGVLVILLKVEEVSVVKNMIKKKILSKNKNIDLEIEIESESV